MGVEVNERRVPLNQKSKLNHECIQLYGLSALGNLETWMHFFNWTPPYPIGNFPLRKLLPLPFKKILYPYHLPPKWLKLKGKKVITGYLDIYNNNLVHIGNSGQCANSAHWVHLYFLQLTAANRHYADCRMNKVEVGGWCNHYDYYFPASSRLIGGVVCQDIIKMDVQHANNTVVQDIIHPVFLFGLYHAHHRINGISGWFVDVTPIAAFWQLQGSLIMSGSLHERKHIDLMKMSDDSDCCAEVNSRLAMLFTRFDGAGVAANCHLIVSRKYILSPYPPLKVSMNEWCNTTMPMARCDWSISSERRMPSPSSLKSHCQSYCLQRGLWKASHLIVSNQRERAWREACQSSDPLRERKWLSLVQSALLDLLAYGFGIEVFSHYCR